MARLCRIFTKQHAHSSRATGFCSMPPFMCRHFFSSPCLVDQGYAALLRVPLKSWPSLSDVLSLLNTLLLRRSKASEEFIKRNYSKKKKKTEREEDQDIRDVPLNKLSNIGGEERQRGHDKRNIGRESTGFNKGMTCIVIVIESGNEQP